MSDLQAVLNAHAEWIKGAGGQRADLREADLRGADLWRADLQGADLRGAVLREADLWGAELQDAVLWGADLQGADLWESDLRQADLQGAIDAPIQMQVGPWLVYIQGGYMRIGYEHHPAEDWRSFDDERIADMERRALEFWRTHRDWLLAACDAQAKTRKEDDHA